MARKTKLFLLYTNEDISLFNHPDIIPLKLNQTEYFESEAFRMITPEMIPDDVDQIGCITPNVFCKKKLFKKQTHDTLDKLLNVNVDKGFFKILPRDHKCDNHFFSNHGENARRLWLWMLEQLDLKWALNKYNGFYCNCWITTKDTFLDYLAFIKRVFILFDNAPQDIKDILLTDPNYNGKLIGTGVLEKMFDKPYYPWQPFIFERIVCLFAYINESSRYKSVKPH
jgi:hypothetical protein